MSIQPNKRKLSSKSSSEEVAVTSKIPLFYKAFKLKGFSTFIVLLLMMFPATNARASFFSSIGDFFGMGVEAAEEVTNDAVDNSQTIALMEPSLTPDLKLSSNAVNVHIVDDEALESNISMFGTSDIDAQYVSDRKIEIYTVQAGDTLEKISKKFGISKNTLINSNDSLASSGKLKVGQVIVILPVEGVAYEVKKGDTIGGIAIKYKSSVDGILKYNDLEKASDLQIGDTIVIPGGKKPVAKPKEKEKENEKPKKDTSPVPDVPKSDNTTGSGGYIWPVPEGVGRITQRLHDDTAVDIGAPKGTPIYAVKDGRVLVADGSGYNGGFGLYVVLDFDDGGQALYGHMSKVIAVAGQTVKQGDVIGLVGSTGKSTGPHIHFSMRGGYKNPFAYLKKGNTSAHFK